VSPPPRRSPASGRLAGAYRALTRQERIGSLGRRLDLLEEGAAETLAVDRRLEPELRRVEEQVLDLADPDRPGRKG
jgi:hypothetical protein